MELCLHASQCSVGVIFEFWCHKMLFKSDSKEFRTSANSCKLSHLSKYLGVSCMVSADNSRFKLISQVLDFCTVQSATCSKGCVFTIAVGSLHVGSVYISVTSFTGHSLLKHINALTPENNCLECILQIYSAGFF